MTQVELQSGALPDELKRLLAEISSGYYEYHLQTVDQRLRSQDGEILMSRPGKNRPSLTSKSARLMFDSSHCFALQYF